VTFVDILAMHANSGMKFCTTVKQKYTLYYLILLNMTKNENDKIMLFNQDNLSFQRSSIMQN